MFDWLKKKKPAASAPAPRTDDGGAFFNALRDSPAPIPAGEHAMWFQSPEEPAFAGSASLQAIDRLYSATAGIEEAVLARILRQLGKAGPDVLRVLLPDETEVWALAAGDSEQFLASANQEKGIRLHFYHATPFPFRILALNGLAAYVEACRPAMEEMVRREGAGNCDGQQWWALSRKVALEVETNADPLLRLGKLVF